MKYVRTNCHCIIDNPFPEKFRELASTLKGWGNKTLLGHAKFQVGSVELNKRMFCTINLSFKSRLWEGVDWKIIALAFDREIN